MSNFGSRVKVRRNMLGLSQEKLGDRLGSTQNTVHRWESGKTTPDIDFLVEIARALETTPNYLLGFTEDPGPEPETEHFTDQERELLEAFRQLPNRQKDFMRIVQALSEE